VVVRSIEPVTALNADITNNSTYVRGTERCRRLGMNEFLEQGESSNCDLKE